LPISPATWPDNGAVTSRPSPPGSQGSALSGVSIGVGFLVSGLVVLLLPKLLGLTSPWPVTGRVAAWMLLTIGLAGTGIELERLGRRGWDNLGIGLSVLSAAAALLALATRVLNGAVAPVVGVIGVVVGLFGIAGTIDGLGKIFAAPAAAGSSRGSGSGASSTWSAAEKVGVLLSAAQLLVGLAALFG